MVGAYIVYFKVKDRKESLVIWQDGDTMRLLLSDDEYCEFDISDIKDDKKRIDEELLKVVQNRAKELVKFVDRVSFFKDSDKTFEDELLSIIQKG